MKNEIINGDSLREMSRLKPESVDLIFADPPYWMRTEGVLNRVEGTEFSGCNDDWDRFDSLAGYESFTEHWLTESRRLLKPNGSIWVIGSMQCIYTIGAIMQRLGFWFINDVIWHKRNPTPNFRGSRLNNSHETLIWSARDKHSRFTFNYKTAKELNDDSVTPEDYARGVRKQMGSVWRFSVCSGNERLKDSEGRKIHSTQKPVKLLERIIAISSRPGDIVLDPFAGTMTTGAAAKRLGRGYIMIESNETYCEHGRLRLEGVALEEDAVSRADYDVKPKRVTLSEMIESGALISGEKFMLEDGTHEAVLNQDGRLTYHDKVMDIHTCAAIAKGGRAARINGFDVWYVRRNDKLVSIKSVRESFRKGETINA